MRHPADVITFWFEQHGQADWFSGKPEFDAAIAAEFGETHAAVVRGEGWTWRSTPLGRLAEIIVLDQFSRQLFRGDARAFAQDGMALVLAEEAVAGGFDTPLPVDRRGFLYMPFMHSESLLVHEAAQPLMAALGGDFLKSAEGHLAVLRRFGRYPKRNAALGRVSTPEELAYIADSGNSMF